MATACTRDDGAARAAERVSWAEADDKSRAARLGGKRGSIYLSEGVPVWG
jgi:hypothetical protein